MKNTVLFLLICFCFGSISAQVISGRVADPVTGLAIRGVQIVVPETSFVTFTDASGSFEFQADRFPLTLNFSSEGYGSSEIRVEDAENDLLVWLVPVSRSLSEVVVRSSLISKEILSTPGAVSVIRSEDLKRTDGTALVEALNSVSGVYVQQGALNTNKINIRGIGARAQYSSNRLKAYFMGIPVSTAEGETTLDDIDPNVIERVEIIKGPASGIYGAGLGGVVNLYAKEPKNIGTKAGVETSVGSFNTWKHSADFSHASQKGHFSASFNNLKTDGFRENGEYDRRSLTLTGQLYLREKNKLSFLGQFIRLKAFIPSSLSREDFENDPSSAAFTWKAAKGYESYDKGLFGIAYEHRFSEVLTNTTSVFLNFRNGYEPRPFNILDEDQLAAGGRTQFSLKNIIFELPSEISFGAELYREWYQTAIFEKLYEENSGAGSKQGNVLNRNDQDRSYWNAFAQWDLDLSQKATLEAGFNVNSTSYELADKFEQDEIDQSGDYRFKTMFSPRLGLSYSVGNRKNVYAVISHGFSTPTVAETLTPEGLINTALQSETGVNYEIGFKGSFLKNRLYTELALYTIQVKNLLVAERVGEDQYIGRNLGKTDHSGIEFLVQYNAEFRNGISLKPFVNGALNYFYFDEFFDRGSDFSGNKLPAVPNRIFYAGLDILTPLGLSIFTSFQHEGAMPLNDENSGFTESFNLINLKIAYKPRLFKNWETEVFAGIKNVFDEHYAASVVPNAVGFGGSAPRYYYPGDPQNYFAGLSVGYTF